MTSLRNAAVLLFAAVLLSMPLVGQVAAPPGMTPSMALADNTAWCATSNCLTPLPATPGTMTELKAGYDGTLYVLDAAAPYQLASGAWAEVGTNLQTAGGYPLIHVSVASASQVLAINSQNEVYVLNSSGTGWAALPNNVSCLNSSSTTIWSQSFTLDPFGNLSKSGTTTFDASYLLRI